MPDPVSMHRQLIDAAVRAASIHGIAKLSMSDVAKTAGVSRQTLYKHFPSKDALVAEAVLSQANELTAEVVLAAAGHTDQQEVIEVGIVTILRLTAAHPLLHRLVETEPESLLPLLIRGDSPVVHLVRGVIEDLLGRDFPGMTESDVPLIADMLARLVVSFAINPPAEPPEVVAATLARLLGAATGAPDPSPPRRSGAPAPRRRSGAASSAPRRSSAASSAPRRSSAAPSAPRRSTEETR